MDTGTIYAPEDVQTSDLQMEIPDDEMAKARCCVCGVAIVPNHSNTCLLCLKQKIDIAEGIMK